MVVFIACVLLAGCTREIKVELPATNPYAETVVLEETFHGVPVRILDKLIQSESSWRYTVVNRSECEVSVGLAQINLKWLPYFHNRYGIKDPANPWQSLIFAADYLRDLYRATGSWEDAVVAYKTGLSNLGRESGWVRMLAKKIAE
jgi:hypothetical protein